MIKYLAVKDKLRRFKFLLLENEKLRLKSMVFNRDLSYDLRCYYMLRLNYLSRNSSFVRVVNRCLLTNRSHGILRKFQLSRISFKEYVGLNMISSIRKSSW
jgi:small subunit ribosomal protein S14